MNEELYDILGIGFGPANLALAISMEEMIGELNCKFIEASPDTIWQKEMLLDTSDIQNIPHRDLITPVNPRSKFTFMNYLVEHDKFFDYMNLMVKYPLRKDYAKYIKWCASHFSKFVNYNTKVIDIELRTNSVSNKVYYAVHCNNGLVYNAKTLIVGTGRTPYIPKEFENIKSDKITHLTNYLSTVNKKYIKEKANLNIAVVGASQSAVEIILDLSNKFPHAKISSFIRNFSFVLKNVSPFSYEMLFPKFIDHYFNRTQKEKDEIKAHLHTTNYSSVDGDVLDKLYLKLYEQDLDGNKKIFINKETLITSVEIYQDTIKLEYMDKHTKNKQIDDFDLVILATGFKDMGSLDNQEKYPPMLKNIINNFKLNDDGFLEIKRDYSLPVKCNNSFQVPPLYLNGLCETSHGFGDAGSISLLSIRAKCIKQSLQKHVNYNDQMNNSLGLTGNENINNSQVNNFKLTDREVI